MALNSAIIWECRASATANNVNGGGFKAGASGTDYSQQNAAHLTITDLVIGADNTTVTSASTPFDSADIGNVLHITAGTNFTVGWYEVTAVNTVTATLDRACGTALATGGTAYLGGAMSLGSTLDDDFFDVVVASNIIYIKSGNYTLGETVAAANAGAATIPTKFEGYNATRGDDPTGTNRPLIACGSNGFTIASNWVMKNIRFTGNGANVIKVSAGNEIINIKSENFYTTANGNAFDWSDNGHNIFNSEFISYRGRGMNGDGTANIVGCYIHDSSVGINASGAALRGVIANNIIESCVTSTINFGAASAIGNVMILNNTLYGSENTTGIGINMATGCTNKMILNNIIYGFVTGITHADATQTDIYADYNTYFNNDTNRTNVMTGDSDIAVNPTFTTMAQVTGTAGTYAGSTLTDAAANFNNVVDGQDFVYIISGTGMTAGQYKISSHTQTTVVTDIDAGENTAANVVYQVTTGRNFAVGTNMKAVAFPGAFQAGLSTGYLDIGAVQRQEPAGGTGGGAAFFTMGN